MEGISIHVKRTDILPASHFRADLLKSMKRSVSDISPSPQKRMEKVDNGSSQSSFGGNQVSVVSVRYDVPKAPSTATLFRFRKMHTPAASPSSFHRSKSEDKINSHTYITNVPEYPLKLSARLERRVKEQKEEKKKLQESDQLSGNVETHRLKGLGVGKCYMEYRPPPTAPDGYRSGVTPATTPGLLCHTPSTNPSSTPSQQPSRLDQANMKSTHTKNNNSQIKSAQNYLQRAKSFMQDDRLLSYKSQSQHTFNASPLMHSPNLHVQDQGPKGQGRMNQGFRGFPRQNPQDFEQGQRIPGERDLVYRGYSFHEREKLHKNGYQDKENGYRSSVHEREHSFKISYHERENGYKSGSLEREHSYKSSKQHENHVGERMNGEDGGYRGVRYQNGNHMRNGDFDEEMMEYNKFYRVRCPVTLPASPVRSVVIPAEQESLLLGVTNSLDPDETPCYSAPHQDPNCIRSSSSTPTVPYSTADILYGNEVNKREQTDELRQNSIGELDKGRELTRQKSKELDNPNNRRPNSKSGNRRSISIDAVSFDKDSDPVKTIPSSLPPAKPTNHFRPNGIRSNLLKGDNLYQTKNSNGAASGRDQDDLIATGTEWGYNNKSQQPPPQSQSQVAALATLQQQQGRVSSVPNNTNNSYPAKVASSSSSTHQSMSSTTNNAMVPQRKYASNNIRPIVVQQNNVSGKKQNNTKMDEDPKYTDPMIGAPASFQQRIIELGALEGDTVRWERTKRLKKKKQDRDS